MAWTSAPLGFEPSVPSKVYSVVKVCAGRAIVVIAHSPTRAYVLFLQLSLPNALASRFIFRPFPHIDVLLFYSLYSPFGYPGNTFEVISSGRKRSRAK